MRQEGLGKPDVCEGDEETEDGHVELVDGVEEPCKLSMTVGEGDTSLVFLNDRDIFSLKTEELKAELDKRGLKKSGKKCTLVERLRAAMMSEYISPRNRLKMITNTYKLRRKLSRRTRILKIMKYTH